MHREVDRTWISLILPVGSANHVTTRNPRGPTAIRATWPKRSAQEMSASSRSRWESNPVWAEASAVKISSQKKSSELMMSRSSPALKTWRRPTESAIKIAIAPDDVTSLHRDGQERFGLCSPTRLREPGKKEHLDPLKHSFARKIRVVQIEPPAAMFDGDIRATRRMPARVDF